jgi:hypothetical protein
MTGFDEKSGPAPHFIGHRERLKVRFREQGGAALADYEFLELLLFQAVPRRDTKPLARRYSSASATSPRFLQRRRLACARSTAWAMRSSIT